ncbi:MAG TPA: helix-turn-helix domain-containing protein [Caulobacteraceae bacterium]|jgi:excisionase family DNA binding protein|nr:helix-turn-helix domain-containing protein [Caulobacteraceae bacterium]
MSDQSLAERIAALLEAEKPSQVEAESRPLAYSFQGAAQATGVGVSTLRREVRAGRLHAVRLRGRVVIPAEELQRYLSGAERA